MSISIGGFNVTIGYSLVFLDGSSGFSQVLKTPPQKINEIPGSDEFFTHSSEAV